MKNRSVAYFKILFFISSFLLVGNFVFSQENIFITAEKYFEKGEYYSAAKLYEQYLLGNSQKQTDKAYRPYFVNRKEIATAKTTNEPARSRASWKLAESYRLSNNFINAEKWYKLCVEKYAAHFPLVDYYYGVCLRANKNYSEAETWLNNFLTSYKENDEYTAAAKKELQNLAFTRKQLVNNFDSNYDISKLILGSEGGAFAASSDNDSMMVFTSTQTDSTAFETNKNPYKNRLFNGHINADKVENIQLLNIENNELNQGTATFFPRGKKMFFTQWKKNNGKLESAVYYSVKEKNKWSRPSKVPLINIDGYNSMHPFISMDGKWLFFSSDRPGGAGNFDIWYAMLDNNGNPSTPVNAGKEINTNADEKSPWYSGDDGQLIFSSNGRTGFGGFDFFIANRKDKNSWEEPANMGLPFNSSKDDIYFYARSSGDGSYETYISSDRESECCLELFHITRAERNKTIGGLLIDCNTSLPLPAGKIYMSTYTGNFATDSVNTDNTGKFYFNIGKQDSIEITGSMEGYTSNKAAVKFPARTKHSFMPDSVQNIVICLDKIANDTIVLKKEIPGEENSVKLPGKKDVIVYFDFDKYNLDKLSRKKLDSLSDNLSKHPSITIEIGGYTDDKGDDEYNLDLGYKRAKSVAKYLMAKGIAAKRIRLKSYGECCPANNEETSEESKDRINRRVQFMLE